MENVVLAILLIFVFKNPSFDKNKSVKQAADIVPQMHMPIIENGPFNEKTFSHDILVNSTYKIHPTNPKIRN